MPITRPSTYLINKQNIRPKGSRISEAWAEDFIEIANILTEIIEVVEAITGGPTQNPLYGVFTSLTLLNATYPTAVDGAYAIIDAGVGTPSQIALWDSTDNVWVLQVAVETTINKPITQGDNVYNIIVTDNNNNQHIIVSGTFIGTNPTKLEDYSLNSYTRAL